MCGIGAQRAVYLAGHVDCTEEHNVGHFEVVFVVFSRVMRAA
jgi:hypothetical protein